MNIWATELPRKAVLIDFTQSPQLASTKRLRCFEIHVAEITVALDVEKIKLDLISVTRYDTQYFYAQNLSNIQ